MSESSSLSKVVVRKRDGSVVSGFASQKPPGETFEIISLSGSEESFELGELKALFFVRDFQGDPKYEEIRFLTKKNPSLAVWVRLTLFDGEVLEGRIENGRDLLDADGIFLWPSDDSSNNHCAYIPKSALKDFRILSAD